MRELLLAAVFLELTGDLLHSAYAGESCLTPSGKYGLCLDGTSCPAESSHASASCPSSEVCCLQEIAQPLGRSKRESDKPSTNAEPTAVPNLRVKGCGMRNVSTTDFIVGGTDAEYWPWMAAIFFRRDANTTPRFQCGGTVISKKYILTAAHCLLDGTTIMKPNQLTVRVGGLTQTGDGRVYRVAKVKKHKNYISSLHYDDIALLELSEEIQSKRVVPACLPSTGMYNANFYKRNATVLGWGRRSLGGPISKVLQEAIVPIVSTRKCDPRYRRLNSYALPRGIIDSQLCAGMQDGSRDSCQGDSGGPLLLEDRSYRWNVVGIVSFGYNCAEPEYPGVYTRVAKYLLWLRDNTDIPERN